MQNIFSVNAGTIAVGVVLLVAVASIVRNMIKKALRGQCVSCDGCGGGEGCPRCAGHGADKS